MPLAPERIGFQPTVRKWWRLPSPSDDEEAIISFGQGEGEPLLAEAVIKAITLLRQKTKAGTSISYNASYPTFWRSWPCRLNTARVSLFSADPKYYRFYHQPRGYGLNKSAKPSRTTPAWGLCFFEFINFADLPMPVPNGRLFSTSIGRDDRSGI